MANTETYTAMAQSRLRPIAEGISVSNDTFLTGLNNNDLIIGPSGCGKTGGYVIPNLLACEGSVVCADTKRSLYRKLGPLLRQRGYEIFVVDFVEPQSSTPYNPLDYLQIDPDTNCPREQDVLSITAALACEMDKDEPFWTMAARTMLSCLISYVMEVFPEEERNLNSVVEVFKALNNAYARIDSKEDRCIPFLESHALAHPDSFAAKKYFMFKGLLAADKTWSCVTQFVSTAIDAFDYKEARALFKGTPDFRIQDLGRKKAVVFLNISDTDRTFDKLVNLFYTQAIQVLCKEADNREDSRLAVPVRLILDDFATNAYIPDFDKIISVIRSRDISVSVILQSLTQLSTMYSEAATATIVNNCDHILYMGGTDMQTTEYVAYCTNKPREVVMTLPLDKAYLIIRGERARMVTKLRPYAALTQVPTAKEPETAGEIVKSE